jgi:elongation factor G
MLDEVKSTDLFLLKRLLIMMKICWKNSWKMKTITEEEINKALRAAVMDMAYSYDCWFFFKNKGVQFMLDAVCKYLPSPVDKEVFEGFILMPIY